MGCINPYYKQDDGKYVPCGKCLPCKTRRASSWSFRLMQHAKNVRSAYFLTLTYDTENVPITKHGYMSLSTSKRNRGDHHSKGHIAMFFKRLRKAHGDKYPGFPIKYYCVGEYGGRTFRPHYHIILFNAELELMLSQKDIMKVQLTNFNGKAHVRVKQWWYGHCSFGKVQDASVGYTLKYISKPKQIPMHRRDDRVPEYSLMSKGLGLSYLTKAIRAWHLADLCNRMYCNLPDGIKIAMPRYYKLKLYDQEQRDEIASFFERTMEKMEILSDEQRLALFKADRERQRYLSRQNQKI